MRNVGIISMSSTIVPCEETPLRGGHITTDASACSSTIAASDNSQNTSSSHRSSSNGEMDDSRRIVMKICIDFAVIAVVAFPILAFFLWGKPYERGFFCDDESLMHPFLESTVRNWMLYVIGLVLPVALITLTESIKANFGKHSNAAYKRLQLGSWPVPTWVVNTYKHAGFFAFGAVVSQLTTDIAKYSIGRLRPHFFDVCRPVMADGTTCADSINLGRYIEEFHCSSTGVSARTIKEMRLSFPSGHASFAAYTMIYTAIYLHARMTWRGSRLLKNFIQFLLITLAWWTALTRISDYKHHWSDVLSGATIGTFVALIVSSFVSDLFARRSDRCTLPQRYELGASTAAMGTTPSNGSGN